MNEDYRKYITKKKHLKRITRKYQLKGWKRNFLKWRNNFCKEKGMMVDRKERNNRLEKDRHNHWNAEKEECLQWKSFKKSKKVN